MGKFISCAKFSINREINLKCRNEMSNFFDCTVKKNGYERFIQINVVSLKREKENKQATTRFSCRVGIVLFSAADLNDGSLVLVALSFQPTAPSRSLGEASQQLWGTQHASGFRPLAYIFIYSPVLKSEIQTIFFFSVIFNKD